jgi:hypothetical protein
MRALRFALVVAFTCLLAGAPAANAEVVAPKSAPAFRNSVGVVTHLVYYDTAYADYRRIVTKLDELGVRHVRDGVYANPAPQWRDWNERHYRAVEYAAAHGIRFTVGMGEPGSPFGTLHDLIGVVKGRLRGAIEALEEPNEFDHFTGGPRWRSRLTAYDRDLYRAVKADPSLRSLPVIGPSLGLWASEKALGDQEAWLDVGNVHPYTGGLSPNPTHLHSALALTRIVSGRKPIWATEAGYNTALRARTGQPPVSEHVGAVYTLRTFLEHFGDGVRRTFTYELIDEKPDPNDRDPEQHYGLLRNDFTPKPAFTALKNLLTLVGRGGEEPRLRPLSMRLSGADEGVRELVLQKADGSYLVALWRLNSVWNIDRRRAIPIAERPVTVTLPQAARVARADPIASDALTPVRLRRARVRIELGGRPLVLHVTPKHRG